MSLNPENPRYGSGLRRKIWIASGCIFILAVLAGILYGSGIAEKNTQPTVETKAVVDKPLTVDEKVDKLMTEMTPAEKIGQMMMIGVKGTDVNADSLYMLHEYHMGGVILFDRNMENQQQVKQLIGNLQQQADEKAPLFVAVDEEGGDVARMKGGLQAPPSQKEIGQSGKKQAAKDWAVKTAVSLKSMGFNINFAPVADVGSNDRRSYSKTPAEVTAFVKAAAGGYEQEKMLYSLKHFPGIGKGKIDSHVDAYRIPVDNETLHREDLLPFQTLIREKNPDNFFVLVSHLTYPALDETYPASLSKKIVTGVLRNEMGYKGLIITDDTEMGALSKHYEFKDIGVKAVEAGADIVMVCHEYEHEKEVYNGLLKAVQSGEISQERVDASVRRILRVKLLHLM